MECICSQASLQEVPHLNRTLTLHDSPPSAKLNKFDSSEENLLCLQRTLQQIDLIHLMIEKSPDHLAIAESATDVMPIFKSGKIVSLLGIEGLHQTAYSASALRMFHRLGVRYATLSHNHNNHCADSAVRIRPNLCVMMLLKTGRLVVPSSTVVYRISAKICCER